MNAEAVLPSPHHHRCPSPRSTAIAACALACSWLLLPEAYYRCISWRRRKRIRGTPYPQSPPSNRSFIAPVDMGKRRLQHLQKSISGTSRYFEAENLPFFNQTMAFPDHTVVMLAASSQRRTRSRAVVLATCASAFVLAAVALVSSNGFYFNRILESSPADAQLPVYHDISGEVINSIEDRLDSLQATDRRLKNKLARLEDTFDKFSPIPGPRGFPGQDGVWSFFVLCRAFAKSHPFLRSRWSCGGAGSSWSPRS
jgi:hypothetical protein